MRTNAIAVGRHAAVIRFRVRPTWRDRLRSDVCRKTATAFLVVAYLAVLIAAAAFATAEGVNYLGRTAVRTEWQASAGVPLSGTP